MGDEQRPRTHGRMADGSDGDTALKPGILTKSRRTDSVTSTCTDRGSQCSCAGGVIRECVNRDGEAGGERRVALVTTHQPRMLEISGIRVRTLLRSRRAPAESPLLAPGNTHIGIWERNHGKEMS